MAIKIVQPLVPIYRVALFDRLFERAAEPVEVYASTSGELGRIGDFRETPRWFHPLGPVLKLPMGMEWQVGATSIPLVASDTLVLCGAPRAISTLIILARARRLGVKTVWWGHFRSSTSRGWRVALRLHLLRFVDCVLFYTDQEVTEFEKTRFSNGRIPIFGLNNGIDTTEISNLRSEYRANNRPRDALFIGRLTEKANLQLVLEALTHASCSDMGLEVIGDGPLLPILKARAVELGVASRVRWHGEVVNEKDIARVANQCKVFVYPGSVGLSLIHALAYGLPSIVHNERWHHMPEVSAHSPGENGCVFEQGDAGSLAACLKETLSDNANLQKMSTEAIRLIDASFNVEDMTRRFLYALSLVSD